MIQKKYNTSMTFLKITCLVLICFFTFTFFTHAAIVPVPPEHYYKPPNNNGLNNNIIDNYDLGDNTLDSYTPSGNTNTNTNPSPSSGNTGTYPSQNSGVSNSVTNPNSGGGDNSPNSFPNPFKESSSTNTLYGFVFYVFSKIIMPIAAIVVVFYIIYAGFLFVSSRGNEEKLSVAKRALLHAIIGAAILLGALTIAKAIQGTICQISGNKPSDLCSTSINSSSRFTF